MGVSEDTELDSTEGPSKVKIVGLINPVTGTSVIASRAVISNTHVAQSSDRISVLFISGTYTTSMSFGGMNVFSIKI